MLSLGPLVKVRKRKQFQKAKLRPPMVLLRGSQAEQKFRMRRLRIPVR